MPDPQQQTFTDVQPIAQTFSNVTPIGGQPTPQPTDALSKATGIGPGPNWFAQKWNEIKAGFSGAGEGKGLPSQPTALGNAAEFAGMAGKTAAFLGLSPGMAESVGAAEAALPSAERAGKAFQELKGVLGSHTVAVTDKLADTLGEIKQASDTGSTLPSVINKFVTRIADTEEGPLTYNEARQFYHNVSELSASERMAAKPSDLRLINLFKYALGDTISQTAESAGRLVSYQNAMSEYAAAKRISGIIEAAKPIATRMAISAAGGGAAYAGYRTLRDLLSQ